MQDRKEPIDVITPKKTKIKRNNRDSALLHFMFIRDEITSLPRPRQGNRNKTLDDGKSTPQAEKAKLASTGTCHHELAEGRELNDRMLDWLDAYERAIQRIDRVALHALSTLGDVQVGGRKPKLEVKELARTVARRHLHDQKKLPTSRELYFEVRHELFKNDPQTYIKKVKKGMDPVEVARNSIDPVWSFWRTIDGLVSERTLSAILTQLRNENKKIQQK